MTPTSAFQNEKGRTLLAVKGVCTGSGIYRGVPSVFGASPRRLIPRSWIASLHARLSLL